MRSQKGFAGQILVILLVIALVAGGAGYYVFSKRNKSKNLSSQSSSVSAAAKAAEATAKAVAVDGTAKSAVAEVTNQVTAEAKLDDNGLNDENAQVSDDDASSVISKVEGSVNEKDF